MDLELKVKLDKKWLHKIADFIEQSAKAMGCHNSSVIEDIKLAVDEVSANIMTYGKATHKKDYFIIRLFKKDSEIGIEIIDYAKPFAFDVLSSTPINHLPWEERLRKGFGLGIVRSVTEDLEYETYPDRNIIRFYKHF